MQRGKIGASALRKPTKRANNALIFLFALNESRAIVKLIRFRDGVYQKAGAIQRSIGSNVASMNIVVFNEMSSKPGLAEMNRDNIIRGKPLEVCAKEPFRRSHKLNGNKRGKEGFKFAFNLGVLGKVNKIINVETQSEG
jgi:hypothetical protein